MIDAIEDINIIPFKKVLRKTDLVEKTRFSFYLNDQSKNSSEEVTLPEEQKEFPVEEWIMPAQPQGYIKSRNNDLL